MKRLLLIVAIWTLALVVLIIWETLALPAERSGRWEAVRKHHLEEESACAVCGGTEELNVHHVRPFHLWPELELSDENLITLCDRHHLLFGHLGDFKAWNPTVREDAAVWREKIKARKYER